jgi:hypothetical protein
VFERMDRNQKPRSNGRESSRLSATRCGGLDLSLRESALSNRRPNRHIRDHPFKFTTGPADAMNVMYATVRNPPAMSNAERQRKFRESHPGYFRRFKISARKTRNDLAMQALFAKGSSAPAQPATDAPQPAPGAPAIAASTPPAPALPSPSALIVRLQSIPFPH